MSEHGAALQNYNQELVKYVEKLRAQSQILKERIKQEECTRDKVADKISELDAKLNEANASIADMKKKKAECDRVLAETECGLQKILETSEILLNVIEKEATSLNV